MDLLLHDLYVHKLEEGIVSVACCVWARIYGVIGLRPIPCLVTIFRHPRASPKTQHHVSEPPSPQRHPIRRLSASLATLFATVQIGTWLVRVQNFPRLYLIGPLGGGETTMWH